MSETIKIGNETFNVSLFCWKKVGDTENMKFRVTKESTGESLDLDDLEEVAAFFKSRVKELLINMY